MDTPPADSSYYHGYERHWLPPQNQQQPEDFHPHESPTQQSGLFNQAPGRGATGVGAGQSWDPTMNGIGSAAGVYFLYHI